MSITTKNRIIVALDSQKLNTYQNCPKRYWFSFHKNIQLKRRKKTALDFGTVTHDLHAHVNRGLKNGEKLSKLHTECLTLETLQQIEVIEDRLFCLKRFLEYYKHYEVENTKYKVVAVEDGFSKILFENDEVVFVYEGKIDVLLYNSFTSRYVWRDYKTHSGKFLYKHSNQFLGYSWAVGDQLEGEIDYIGKHKEAKNQETKVFIREPVEFHANQIARWKERAIRTYWQIINDVEFNENPSACDGKYGLCQFCKLCERSKESHDGLIEAHYEEREPWAAW